jgi:hypothetical protein
LLDETNSPIMNIARTQWTERVMWKARSTLLKNHLPLAHNVAQILALNYVLIIFEIAFVPSHLPLFGLPWQIHPRVMYMCLPSFPFFPILFTTLKPTC